MDMVVRRFEVYLVALNPTVGSEIQKLRPCVVVSPQEMNDNLSTIIIAPMTSTRRNYPSRIDCTFDNVSGQIALDQLRAVDKTRLRKKLGVINDAQLQENVLDLLQKIFS